MKHSIFLSLKGVQAVGPLTVIGCSKEQECVFPNKHLLSDCMLEKLMQFPGLLTRRGGFCVADPIFDLYSEKRDILN